MAKQPEKPFAIKFWMVNDDRWTIALATKEARDAYWEDVFNREWMNVGGDTVIKVSNICSMEKIEL